MQLLLLGVYALIGAALIALVLLQHGKGSDVGAAFGSGASNAIFGPVGPGTVLSRATAVLAAIFFALSLGLAWQSKRELAPQALELEGGLQAVAEPLDGSEPAEAPAGDLLLPPAEADPLAEPPPDTGGAAEQPAP